MKMMDLLITIIAAAMCVGFIILCWIAFLKMLAFSPLILFILLTSVILIVLI
jgi:hypothetical protein